MGFKTADQAKKEFMAVAQARGTAEADEARAARYADEAAASEAHRAEIAARTSVEDVLAQAGFVQERGSSSYPKYRHPARASSVVVYPSGGWIDNLTQKGCYAGEFASAALAKHLGFSIFQDDDQAVLRVPVDARPKKAVVKAEIPAEVIENWKFAREYLVQTRKIPAEIVDELRNAGQVYSDNRKQVVFKRAGGVFIRSTTTDWKQSIGIGAAPFVAPGDGRLFLAEAPINALSLLHLNPGATVAATGGGFALASVAKLIEQAAVVCLCFDNDDEGNDFAGDRLIKRVRDGFPQFLGKMVDHKPPVEFKDWNDVLVGKRKPEAA